MLQLKAYVLLLFFCFAFFFSNVKGQINNPFIIGSIGSLGSKIPIYSGPFLINGKSCITINNGIDKLNLETNGTFKCSCLESESIIQKITQTNIHTGISIEEVITKFTVYPNPVISNFFVRGSNGKSNDESTVLLELFTFDGRIIGTYSTSSSSLKSGYHINANYLMNGEYFIKIYLDNNLSSILKFLKAN